ncbi:MAG TPA: pyridoxamine 5'-phosphate oxidase family protein [Vicinamibacteria bacterium]|nr:pyridoxamine 5'-phosphate oxidase family protein [Vicinamibacteria bacterium]
MAKKDTQAQAAKANGSVKKLRKIMRDIRIAMLTTVARDGRLNSRPMMTSDVEFDGNLWFIASTTSALAQEITGNPNVNVIYASPEDDRYISASGTASFMHDQAKLKELWSGKHKAWLPEGKKDPHLALLRVDVQHAECWDDSAESVQFVRPEAQPTMAGAEDGTGAGAQG